MSTTDPDARTRAVQEYLRPAAGVAIVIGVVAGPAAALVLLFSPDPEAVLVPVYLVWIAIAVGFGLFAYYVLHHIPGLSIFAYSIAGTGSMFLLFCVGLSGPGSEDGLSLTLWQPLIPPVVCYVVAIVLYVIQRMRAAGQKQTMSNGVDATATVTRAAIMGRVNAAPLWHLTLSFADQQGTKRWFRTHMLGINWAPGDSVPIRYDPARPSDSRRIVVAPGSEGDMIH